MKSVEKKVDFGAHVADIKVSLFREEGKNYAKIACRNVSGRTLAQIHFKASGTDYFGDIIKIGDRPDFDITISDCNLKPGACLEEYCTAVHDEIRELKLQEADVCFLDGTRESYPGADYHIYHADCFFEDSYRDKPTLDILKRIDESFCCYPTEEKEGWICACAYLNRKDRSICGRCGHNKNEVFLTASREAVAQRQREDQAAFEEKMRQMEERRKRIDRIETIRFFAEVLLGIVLFFLAGYLLLHISRG